MSITQIPIPLRAVVVLSVLLLATMGAGCRRQSPHTVAPTESDLEERPAHESWGTDFRVSKDGLPTLRIRAPYTRRFERGDSSLTILTDDGEERVIATIFDAEGEITATVKANEITYVEEQGRFDAFGAVDVVAESGSLETEHLYWLENTKMLYAPGFAKLYEKESYIQGYEMEATEDLSSYTMARVTGQVEVEE